MKFDMITNPHKLETLNRQLDRQKIPYRESLAIFEALLNEAVLLGAINPENMLDGIDVDIRIANAINKVDSCSKNC